MLTRYEDKLVLTVSELAGAARFTLEERFPIVWVEGELSNLRAPGSGHWYFTLKDDGAQVRCAMFANRNRTVRFKPRDGMKVILRGRVSLYEARGDFQLLADHLEASGEGALRAAFDALKKKLGDEGLFAEKNKRDLPPYPTHVAVISSRSGAALHDVLSVLRRRCPTLRVTLLPVVVQGKDAEGQILEAFDRIAEWPAELGAEPDVVLVARGGGSLEDLWTFNLESVARAIAACPVPVVSAIGHETDFTISDFVADLRAPTPSAGAELIAPDMQDWQRRAARLLGSLHAHWRHAFVHRRQSLNHVARRLTHPGRALQQRMQRLDDLERQLVAAVENRVGRARHAAQLIDARFSHLHPQRAIDAARQSLDRMGYSLLRGARARIETARSQTASLGRALNAVSPLATLGRGFAIVTTPAPSSQRWGTPITSVGDTQSGAKVVANLQDGALHCTVDGIEPNAA
jgi:exodeoxyribonuclease VII large subunit